jgi:hypothetical protein
LHEGQLESSKILVIKKDGMPDVISSKTPPMILKLATFCSHQFMLAALPAFLAALVAQV